MVSGDAQGRVLVLDRATGGLKQQICLHSRGSPVNCIAFSPDGSLLAVGFGDGHLAVFDASTLNGSDSHDSRDMPGDSRDSHVSPVPYTASQAGAATATPVDRFRRSVRRMVFLQRWSQRKDAPTAFVDGEEMSYILESETCRRIIRSCSSSEAGVFE